ncbi:MAG: coproporphyrinogen III oxidase, partial [Paracoccaceae bacterium]
IDEEALPDTHVRFALAERARLAFEAAGYTAVGIDHFARPSDSLARAQGEGRLRRNFQGYTDDTDETVIGLGASAISQFRGGYVQNAVATSAYHERIAAGGLAGHRGYEMTALDRLVARMVEDLMCSFAFRPKALAADFPQQTAEIERTRLQLIEQFGDVLNKIDGDYVLPAPAQPLARIVAHALDTFSTQGAAHAVAI